MTSVSVITQQQDLVVLAGAGVSAGKPSSLPGWKAINAAIVDVLCRRVQTVISRPGWLAQIMADIDEERAADRFPPDYQAQLIEEMCGERYFRALQALDVEVRNTAHEGIAALAASGTVRAIVTTNFDRLIEQALDKRGIPYVVAYDDPGFVDMGQRLRDGQRLPFPIIKIHGCISDHRSMIDTLKQRKRGRSNHLQACLDVLMFRYWVYLGFSAADLETDPNYLGLVAGAATSAGATYVAYPGDAAMGRGAAMLMNAYADRGQVVVAHIADHLGAICAAMGRPVPVAIADDADSGTVHFRAKLDQWAEGLSVAAAGLCLAALMEAVGRAEVAVRVLDRLVRKELFDQRDTADFRLLQLHYGRLGTAWGRFVAVPDLDGAASNASIESTQSLLRLMDSELGFAASSWLACSWLWLGDGQAASAISAQLLAGFRGEHWARAQPRSDEDAVDAWLSAAQVFIINAHAETIHFVVDTSDGALERARRSGDVVRMARVVALKALALAETDEDLPGMLAQYDVRFADATRVGDGFALGMRALAHGRWFVGVGGLALADTTTAAQALALLQDAVAHFRRQGMDPWEMFALIQQAKAYADLHDFDQVQRCVDECTAGLERFPILASHVYEVVGQVQAMLGDASAAERFEAAVSAAGKFGLLARQETLRQYPGRS